MRTVLSSTPMLSAGVMYFWGETIFKARVMFSNVNSAPTESTPQDIALVGGRGCLGEAGCGGV